MSELKRVPSMPVFMFLIVAIVAGQRVSPSQGAPSPQPPGYSAQQERERTEAALRRRSQPEARLEQELRDELGRVLSRYRADGSPSSRGECESLLQRVLALPKPTARAYSLCAMAANVLDRPRQAIDILEKAIAEYPDEHIGRPIIPLRISGRYRIAAIATRIRDIDDAVQAYETILGNLGTIESRQMDEFLCHMYLADLFDAVPGKEQVLDKELEEAAKVAEGFGKNASRQDGAMNARLLRGWVAYESARRKPDAISSDFGPDPNALPSLSSCWMFATVWAGISCPTLPEMDLVAESDNPSVLRVLAGLALAMIYMEDSNHDPVKAEKYLLRVIEEDSYFKPYAKATLALVYEDMREIREKIPVLLKDLKEGDENQREQAAFKLLHECGSEGIQTLQEAQEDPNKYVRYIAACTLANRWQDRSVKLRFDVILDAFADENPRVRGKAGSAVGSHSCIDIGPREMVAMIRLMNEHYSEELMWAVKEPLFAARGKAQVLDVAIPALLSLLDHKSMDVRDGILGIFTRIGPLPAHTVPSLARCLDRAEDEETQVKIIGLLAQIGPAAKEAVPVLTRFAQHDNVNVRNTAVYALRCISPATADKGPRSIEDP